MPDELLDQLATYAWQLDDAVAPVAATAGSVAAPPYPVSRPAVTAASPWLDKEQPPRVVPDQPPRVVPGTSSAAIPRTPIEQLTAKPAPVGPSVAEQSGMWQPTPREPGPVARWWSEAKGQIGSDLATHGLAYLGVLLMFVGAFGLVAFSFGDVEETMRLVAEISIAAVPFLAAWMLLRRGADIVGRALELAGGLLLPVMLITSVLDGVQVPPDLVGVPLVVATTALALVVAGLYALWSRRHTESALRYLVAPLLWLAAGLAAAGVGRPIPSGAGFAVVSAAQVAAISVALAVTLLWVRLRPSAALAAPTRLAARFGTVIVGALALLTWVAQSAPTAAVLVTGIAGLLVVELLDLRGRGYVQAAWWTVTVIALVAGVTEIAIAPLGVLALTGYVVLVELAGRRGEAGPVAVAGLCAVLAALLPWAAPWWALGTMVALALWSGVRRLHPYAIPHAPALLDLTAGASSIAAVVAFGLGTRDAPLAIVIASVLVASSLVVLDVPRVRALLSRDAHDHFWQLWWDAGMVATALAVGVMLSAYWPSVVSARWMLAAAPAVLALSAALGPLTRSWRFVAASSLLLWSWLIAAAIGTWSTTVTAAVPAAVALALVVGAHVVPQLWARLWSPGSVGWSGHLLAVAALVVASVWGDGPQAWLLAATLAGLAAGLAVTIAYDETRGSPVIASTPTFWLPLVRPAVHVTALLALASSTVAALDASGLVTLSSPWRGAVVSALALLVALSTRLRVSDTLRLSLVWSAVVGSLGGLALAGDARAALVALVVVAVLPFALAASARPRAAVWLSWSSIAPIVGLAAQLALPSYADLAPAAQFAIAAVGVGSLLLVGSFAADLRGRSWLTLVAPTRRWLWLPAIVGAAEVLAALLATTVPELGRVAGWVTLTAAACVLATGLLARVWSTLGISAALAWLAVWELESTALQSRPWVAVVCTVALLAGAEVAHRLGRDLRLWVRGDLSLLVVAHVTALTAVVTTTGRTDLALVLLALAVLSVGIAWRLRVYVYAGSAYLVASALMLVTAGAIEGYGWLALALLVVSIACSVAASRLRESAQLALGLVLIGSLTSLAAWLSFAEWLSLTPQARVDYTAMLAAAVVLVGVALLRWTQVERVVLLVRLGVASAALVAAPLAAGLSGNVAEHFSVWTALALLLGAVATGVAAKVLDPVLRYVAVGLALAAVLEAFVALQPAPVWRLAVLAVVTFAAAALLLVRKLLALGEWTQPLALLGWLTALAGIVVACLELPDTVLLPSALVVTGAYSAAYGTAMREFSAQLLAPPLLCAAWIVWAGNALTPNAQWFTVPIGLTLLVLVELIRWNARRDGIAIEANLVLLLDISGVLFLVGASFVQAFTDSLAYAVLAAAIGCGIALWGLLTKVRRRLLIGAVVVLLGVAVLVLVPLADLIPAWSSVTLWVVIACAGLLALLSATLLEQGRAVVRRGLDDLHRLTEGWE